MTAGAIPIPQQTHPCIHEDRWTHTENEIQKLETEKQRFETKIDKKLDKIYTELHDFKLESTKGDSSIDNRVTALEKTVSILKWTVTITLPAGTLLFAALTFFLTHVH